MKFSKTPEGRRIYEQVFNHWLETKRPQTTIIMAIDEAFDSRMKRCEKCRKINATWKNLLQCLSNEEDIWK